MNVEPEVRTDTGVVRGRREGAVTVFRGIPYAQPPVGARRFGPPVPARPWDGVRDALAFGPPVPQTTRENSVALQAIDPAGGSDEWLTLNVWSPDLGAARLPVLVWIHGGAYLTGLSGNPHYDGATLAAAGAVVVSMNYRVGVEGFAHIAGAPDNRGILDQAAALRWVSDNVVAFGGDPGNVTVFGQSAGAGSVAALLAMPTAAGLFRRAIAQSVPCTYFSPQLAAAISSVIAAEVGAQATVADLARIAPGELITATNTVIQRMPELVESWGPMALTPTPFSPVVDGDLLPQAPWRALADGAARGIDLLVGHTRDEYRLLAARGGEVTGGEATAALDRLAPSPDAGSAYRAEFPDATPAQLHELVNSDWLLRMPSLHLADAHHAGGGRAWTYELRWSYNPEQGASHGLDVLLVLDTISADEVRDHPSAGPSAAVEVSRVSHQMRTDWLAFAASGDPGWARYVPDTRLTRVYDADPITVPYPEESSRRIWQEHQFDTLDLPS